MSKIKIILILLITLTLSASLCACKSRTGAKAENQKDSQDVEDVMPAEIEEESASEPASSRESEPEKDLKPERLAQDFLIAARSGERSNIQAYTDYNTLFGLNEGQSADWILQQILMRLRYEVLSTEVGSDKATAIVKITNTDMMTVLPLYYGQAMQLEYDNAMSKEPMSADELENEYRKIFVELMLENEGNKTEKLTEIAMDKDGGDWRIVTAGTLGNAMLGGYLDAQKSVRENPPQISSAPAEESKPDEEGDGSGDSDRGDDDSGDDGESHEE